MDDNDIFSGLDDIHIDWDEIDRMELDLESDIELGKPKSGGSRDNHSGKDSVLDQGTDKDDWLDNFMRNAEPEVPEEVVQKIEEMDEEIKGKADAKAEEKFMMSYRLDAYRRKKYEISQMLSYYSHLKKEHPDDAEIDKRISYYKNAIKYMETELYKECPVKFLSSLYWGEDKKQYSQEEISDYLYNVTCRDEYLAKAEEFKKQRESIQAEIDGGKLDEEAVKAKQQEIKNLLVQEDHCKTSAQVYDGNLEFRINIEPFEEEFDLESFTAQHLEYATEITGQLSKIRQKQLDLIIAAKQDPEMDYPTDALQKLQGRFNRIYEEAALIERIGRTTYDLSVKQEDIVSEVRTGFLPEVSDDEILNVALTQEERYRAGIAAYKFHDKKRRSPSWIKKLTLRSPSKKTDELIKDYIISPIDKEDPMDDSRLYKITGVSKDVLILDVEAQRIVDEERRKAEEALQSQQSKQSGKDADKEEPAKNPEGTSGSGKPAKPEEEQGTGASKDDEQNNEDLKKQLEEVKEKLIQLPLTNRIDVIAEIYNLSEESKNILKGLVDLPPEYRKQVIEEVAKTCKQQGDGEPNQGQSKEGPTKE